jgi:hypothetical protein
MKTYVKAEGTEILEIRAWLIPLWLMKAAIHAINSESGLGGGLLDGFC